MHNRKVKVVFVSGLVGAGKTTFARALKSYLASQGFKVCIYRISAFPLISYTFFRLLACIFYGCKVVKNYEKINVHPSTLVLLRAKRIPFLIMLIVIYLETVSTLLKYLGVFLRCRQMNMIIIDEGLINQFANYIELFGKRSALLILSARIFFEKFKKIFGFDVNTVFMNIRDYSVLLNRWHMRGHPLPTSFIDIKYHLKYLMLVEVAKNIMLKSFNQHIVELYTDEKPLQKLVLEYLSRGHRYYLR